MLPRESPARRGFRNIQLSSRGTKPLHGFARQLEQAILAKVEPFLVEMGGMFSFVGSQYRLEVGNKEYFIDLLLFHRRLRSLITEELKIGAFLPEHIGKMQFYLAVLDDTARLVRDFLSPAASLKSASYSPGALPATKLVKGRVARDNEAEGTKNVEAE